MEENLLQLRLTGTGQDDVRWPLKLVGRLGYLADAVATADFPPAEQHRAVQQELEAELRGTQEALDRILGTDLPAFNRMLRERELTPVIAGETAVRR